MLDLTLKQIIDLAEFAGLCISRQFGPGDGELQTQFTIAKRPPIGVLNEDEPTDQGSGTHYEYFVYYTDFPDEGYVGLGDEIAT